LKSLESNYVSSVESINCKIWGSKPARA